MSDLTSMVLTALAVYFVIVSHEIAHAVVANWNGDSTAKDAGRITLNPLSHIDPLGLVSLLLFKFGWAKPVPINPYRFRNQRLGVLSTSLAGVTVNLLTAVLAAFFLLFFPKAPDWVQTFLYLLYVYGVYFCVFNLLPIPPMDGSKALASLLPAPLANRYLDLEKYSRFLLPILVFSGMTGRFVRPLAEGLLHGIFRFLLGLV